MHKLTHFRLCPHSRSLRLALQELGIEAELVEERPWEQRPQFLGLNPAGELPVLEIEGGPILCGAYAISEYLEEDGGRTSRAARSLALFPGGHEDRAEVRRLVDWFHGKANREVTRELLHERIYAQLLPGPPRAPDPEILRAVRANLRYHLSYLSYLADQRRWLAGDDLSFADCAAAGHLATIDYLGEVPWESFPVAKSWYQRMKSRPSFRTLLADRMPGTPPPSHYADLDF